MSVIIDETHEKYLSDHLREVVRQGISGRDNADLSEKPYRIIFSGVLQPPKNRLTKDLDASAIGLNFQIQAAIECQFIIDASLALYYPIFPPFTELARVRAESDGAPRIMNILPWYRRCPISLKGLKVTFRDGAFDVSEANARLAASVEIAQADILNDPYLWRLPQGTASFDQDLDQIESSEAYAKIIESKISPAMEALPSWSLELSAETFEGTTTSTQQIQLMLANVAKLPDDPYKLTADWNIYDACFEVAIVGADLIPFEYLLAPKDYRHEPELIGRGINCSVKNAGTNQTVLRTETLPVYEQPYYRTRQELDKPFVLLAGDDADKHLLEIQREMQTYVAEWANFLKGETSFDTEEEEACRRDLAKCQAELDRFEFGLECLRRDSRLRHAFLLMNSAFAELGARSGGRISAWRLFQIGFIVSQLPSIAIRDPKAASDELFWKRLVDAFEPVGMLWFPTGGGKTEAYLGLIAVALLYDRLRGKLRGVNTWMRFPLRMLSLQQLERMAKVIAILNEMRVTTAAIAAGDEFSMGYFIGKSASPNRVKEGLAQILAKDSAKRASYIQLMRCPHCGHRVSIEWLPDVWRLAHVCSNMDCFSNTEASRGKMRGSLPLYIVDEEIYRYLPSVLVGTVDKLAGVITRRDVATITSGVEFACEDHGYICYGKCIEKTCKRLPRTYRRLDSSQDPGPTFLVQDEFHLLRDELGVFAGHYEGLLQVTLGKDGRLPPKVLAATATIEAYDNQAFQIYLKRAVRYPESGWKAGESFYATSTPLRYRRSYIGVLGHTRSVEDVTLRIETLYILEIRRLAADPTLCASILQTDDSNAGAATLRLYDFMLVYVNKKSTAGSLKEKQRLVDDQLDRFGYPGVICTSLTGDNSIEDIGEAIDRIEREIKKTDDVRLDILLATSLISHGVDLGRINAMIVTGMPSHYAEYVQSSSRCARSHPGNIFVCFRSRDPRELSQYQSFYAMHEHMDRLIEPVAVNRFASFAPKKTVPGMLVGYCMAYASPKLFSQGRISRPLDDTKTLQAALGYAAGGNGAQTGALPRDEVLDAIRRAIGVDCVHPPALEAEVDRLRHVVDARVEDSFGRIGRSMDQYVTDCLDCLISFRDIDEGVQFSSLDSMELLLKC